MKALIGIAILVCLLETVAIVWQAHVISDLRTYEQSGCNGRYQGD